MHRRAAPSLLALLILIATLATAAPAAAQESIEELEQAAAEAYGKGEYKQAIQLMTRLYGLSPHPNYLLNIAVAYSKIGDCENARLWAQNAVDAREPALPEESISTARSVIEECEKIKSEGNEGNEANNGTGPGNNGNGGNNGGTTTPEPVDWYPIAAYGTLGVGGVLTLLTFFYDLKVSADIEDLEALSQGPDRDAFNNLRSEIESDQTLVLVGYISSGVILAGGGALLVWDLLYHEHNKPADGATPPAPAEPTGRLAPWFAPDAAGVSVQGRF